MHMAMILTTINPTNDAATASAVCMESDYAF